MNRAKFPALRRRLAGLGIATAAAALTAAQATPALAFISGGCKGSATDTTGKADHVVLVTDTHWNVSKDSVLTGQGDAPSDQTEGFAYAMAFGLRMTFVPIAGGTGHGTHGSGSLDISKISPYSRVIAAAGASTSCSGYIVIDVVDESALDTYAGKAGAGAAGVGLIGLGAVGLRKRHRRIRR